MSAEKAPGERVLSLAVIAHEDGQVEVLMDTDRSQAEVRAVLQMVMDQMAPRDRADEFEAFGATRRQRRVSR